MGRLRAWLRRRREPSAEVQAVRATRARIQGLVCEARAEADAILASIDSSGGSRDNG